jgi:hypothetical protein
MTALPTIIIPHCLSLATQTASSFTSRTLAIHFVPTGTNKPKETVKHVKHTCQKLKPGIEF